MVKKLTGAGIKAALGAGVVGEAPTTPPKAGSGGRPAKVAKGRPVNLQLPDDVIQALKEGAIELAKSGTGTSMPTVQDVIRTIVEQAVRSPDYPQNLRGRS